MLDAKALRFAPTIILLLGLLSFAACNVSPPRLPTNTLPATTEPADSTLPPPVESPSPSPVDPGNTATERKGVILVAPPDADPGLAESVQSALADLAQPAGLDFDARPAITASDLTPELRVVVILPAGTGRADAENVVDLAAAAPEIQFLGIGLPAGGPTGNLSWIRLDGSSPDRVGFLAGYIAAVITPEWRVGALTTNDSSAGLAIRQSFLNGVVFFCGLCRQTLPPFVTYPLYAELPASADAQEWQTAASTLIDQAIRTVYLAPGVGDETLLESLAQADVGLIGSQSPPAALRERWVATLTVDISSTLQSVWPDLVAGRGGADLNAALLLTDVNPELFSPGRQLLVEKLIADLQNGYIDTGVQP